MAEQSLPGQPEVDEEQATKRGLPDAWIFTDSGWALIIESKVASDPTIRQLNRHIATAKRRGFAAPNLLLIVVDVGKTHVTRSGRTQKKSWSDLYRWAVGRSARSEWAKHFATYLEIAEAKMIREDYLREGKLTAFTGIPFDSEHPYTYLEAKRLLKLIIEELKGDKGFIGKVGVDKTSPGRPAITGRESTGVWDFLRMARVGGPHTFTRYPHLTVAVGVDHMEADVTLPNGVPEKTRTRVLGEDLEVFEQRMAQVLSNMRGVIRSDDSVRPVVKVLQRHYATQRSLLTRDALIYCDLRTAFRSKRKSAHKYQPEWLRTIYNVMMHKRSNLQFQVGVEIPYIHSTVIKTPRATKLIADAFLALRPLLGRCSSR